MPRILVADDNTNIQRMVALAFQDRGIEVTAVGNGEAAVRRMPELKPDLVLADIFMPVRNGYELCEWVKKDERFSEIPVILLVGAFDPLDEKEARRVGADGVLKKPFIPPDPLIAMVTSALEKNAKVAAELHKPKEAAVTTPLTQVPVPAPVPVAAPTPAPVATVFETPAKIEVKPMPEFPEPTSEEASLAYGFGSGRRALDDDETEEAKVPKAEEDDSTEEFDGASTTNDWRRSAMDFEVPEEAAGRPAFSAVEDLEAAPTFPSERDVPPQKLHVPEAAEEIEPVPQLSFTQDAEDSSIWAASAQSSIAEEVAAASEHLAATREEEIATPLTAAEVQAPIKAVSSVEMEIPVAREIEPEIAPAAFGSTEETVLEAEPGFASKATHWMDMMASSSESSPSDWFASTKPAEEASEVREVPAETEQNKPVEAEAAALEAVEPSGPAIAELVATAKQADDEPFFADEIAPAINSEEVAPELKSESIVAAVSAEAKSDVAADEPPASPVEWDEKLPPREPVASSETAPEIITEPADETPSYRDPALVEPPAVHVTPEPLLIEATTGSRNSGYGAHKELVPPAYSFLLQGKETPAGEKLVAEAPVERPAAPATFQEHEERERPRLEFSQAEPDTRIPTSLPPSREALAEIPFLNPTVASTEEEEEDRSIVNHRAGDSVTVDAVVERLLQKLQPQLRELLSQEVLRPLIENLLQDEREKSER